MTIEIFQEKAGELKAETGEMEASQLLPERKGKKADFTLHVKYRYNATWQGSITNMGTGERKSFLSLMELMDILAVSLGSQIRPGGTGLGKRMCEVTVRNYEGCQMGGDVSHPAVADRRTFINEFDLKEEIAAMLDPLPEGSRPGWHHYPPKLSCGSWKLRPCNVCDPYSVPAQCYLAGNCQLEGKAFTGKFQKLYGASFADAGGRGAYW